MHKYEGSKGTTFKFMNVNITYYSSRDCTKGGVMTVSLCIEGKWIVSNHLFIRYASDYKNEGCRW